MIQPGPEFERLANPIHKTSVLAGICSSIVVPGSLGSFIIRPCHIKLNWNLSRLVSNRSYATFKLTAVMCLAVQNQQHIAAVWCASYFLLLYSLYCISNSFWNILKCSLPCVQFYLLFSKIPPSVIWCFIFSTANRTQKSCSSCSSYSSSRSITNRSKNL